MCVKCAVTLANGCEQATAARARWQLDVMGVALTLTTLRCVVTKRARWLVAQW
jgi:hypothetical protein